jgi:RNA 2',3'-cyclic 3'-phosphodiesterase
MRLFIAIPLGEAVEIALKRLTGRLQPAAPNLRWSLPESWHITLQFLGNASEQQYACLLPRLQALKPGAFAIDFEGLGVFERAGVFLLGVAPAPALVALQKRIVAATEPCGFEPPERVDLGRPYRPHITLARSKSATKGRELRALLDRAGERQRFDGFRASEFRIYESHTLPTGSKYEVKCRFRMGDN